MQYLDPKNDLTFKKIFGKHPHLLQSFLNAVLPLDEPIESLEYLPAELVPEIPLLKHTIVDVRCTDKKGRQFIVEMQMFWTDSFKSRVVFNASKAYVHQLDKGKKYATLQPVYALSLVDDIFEPETTEYYHHYKIVNIENTEKQLKDLEFVFIELPKFKPQSRDDLRMQVLWLRFLTEVTEELEIAPQELLKNPQIKEALENIQVSAFTKEELAQYDKYWDSIRSEISLYDAAEQRGEVRGRVEGEQIGLEKGEQIGLEKGERLKAYKTALKGLRKEMSIEDVIELTELSKDIILKLQSLLEKYGKEAENQLSQIE